MLVWCCTSNDDSVKAFIGCLKGPPELKGYKSAVPKYHLYNTMQEVLQPSGTLSRGIKSIALPPQGG